MDFLRLGTVMAVYSPVKSEREQNNSGSLSEKLSKIRSQIGVAKQGEDILSIHIASKN